MDTAMIVAIVGSAATAFTGGWAVRVLWREDGMLSVVTGIVFLNSILRIWA